MFARMFQIENTKLFKSRLFWVELVILMGFVVLFFGGMFALSQVLPDEALETQLASTIYWPASLNTAMGLASSGGLGGLLIMVLTSVLVAQGYGHRTFSLWLGRGMPRPVALLAQFAALTLAAALLVATATVVGGLASALVTLAGEGSLSFDAVNYAQLGLSILRTAFTLLPYVALTMLFAVLTRSAAGTLGLSVGYSLLIESVLTQILLFTGEVGQAVVKFVPAVLAQSVNSLNGGTLVTVTVNGQSPQMPMLDPTPAAIGLALYTLVFLGLAVWQFRRQDLTA